MRVAIPILALLAACQSGPPAAKAPGTAPAAPLVEVAKEPETIPPGLPAPAGMKLLAENPPPEAFDDPTISATASVAYLPGTWKAADQALVQEADGPGNKLMVRRYIGTGTGPGGTLPDRYHVQVSEWQYHFKGRDMAREMGVLALIPYWKDARHFVILSVRSDVAEGWAADDNEPGQTWPSRNRFWTATMNPPLGVGDAVTWDVEVSVPEHRVVVYLNGQRRAEAEAALIVPGGQVAIAANGNQVRFKNFRLWAAVPDAKSPVTPAATP